MKYDYWFANVKGISCEKKRKLYSYVKCAEELYYIEETALQTWGVDEKDRKILLESAKYWNLIEEFEKLQDKEVQFSTIDMEGYPSRLKNIPSPPYALYFKGRLPKEERTIAIVGARECSSYGRQMATEFGAALAKAGVQLISGMARGIDGAGQMGALTAGGSSFGILGCGVDICYPREHINLYMELQQTGGVISEQPIGMKPLPQFFPARNRIISGFADAVLVIEAKERSGSLITADMALEQGKDVYALPGPVTSRLSRGCHELIRQGAGILLSPENLLEDLLIPMSKKTENLFGNKKLLESEEELLYACLDFYPKSLSELQDVSGLSTADMMRSLIRLELDGYIQEISKNYYVKLK